MKVNGKTALVTGASRGLGRAIALKLGAMGAHVVVNYRQSKDAAGAVVNDIQHAGGSAESVRCDVSDVADLDAMIEQVLTERGAVDILVNNAGSIERPAAWNEQSDEGLNRTIQLNLLAPIRAIRATAPAMVKRGEGRIVNVTTTYALTGAAAVLGYTVSKAGLVPLTYAMARELGPHGITVNAIAPGNFDTDMTASAGDAVREWVIGTTPAGRFGDPSEVGDAIAYIMQADFMNGHVLVLDGGQLLNM